MLRSTAPYAGGSRRRWRRCVCRPVTWGLSSAASAPARRRWGRLVGRWLGCPSLLYWPPVGGSRLPSQARLPPTAVSLKPRKGGCSGATAVHSPRATIPQGRSGVARPGPQPSGALPLRFAVPSRGGRTSRRSRSLGGTVGLPLRTRGLAPRAPEERDHWKFKDRDETKNRGFVMSHDKIEPMIWERF